MLPTTKEVATEIETTIKQHLTSLASINWKIYTNPELAWQENIASEAICTFLSNLEYNVTPHAYGLETALEARYNSPVPGGRCVNFNAEYDALPGLGHACGHNLIATASVVAFVALSAALRRFRVAGDVQLLGTPAEEDGGGKIALLNARAYRDVAVSLMGHPFSQENHGSDRLNTGSAGQRSIAHIGLTATFFGKNAHAGGNPWDGINALDAVVCAYTNISVLRQQMTPDERVHGCILEAPKVAGVIPSRTKVGYSCRSPTAHSARGLADKVRRCFDAAALATGCRLEIEEEAMYADFRINETLCERYSSHMKGLGEQVCEIRDDFMTGCTDQGNVSQAVPALHVIFGIPGPKGVQPHSEEFQRAVGTEGAFEAAVRVGKALAMTGWEILTHDAIYARCVQDFEKAAKDRLGT